MPLCHYFVSVHRRIRWVIIRGVSFLSSIARLQTPGRPVRLSGPLPDAHAVAVSAQEEHSCKGPLPGTTEGVILSEKGQCDAVCTRRLRGQLNCRVGSGSHGMGLVGWLAGDTLKVALFSENHS